MEIEGPIVAGIDLTDGSEAVVRAAARQARLSGVRLYLLHVAPPEPDFVAYRRDEIQRDWMAADLKNEHRRIHQFRELLEADDLSVETLTVQGMTADKLLAEMDKLGASLLVVGTHRHGALHGLLTGSVLFDVLRKAPCPVLVVPSPED